MAQSSTYDAIRTYNRQANEDIENGLKKRIDVMTVGIPVALSKKVELAIEIEEKLVEELRFKIRQIACDRLNME